MMANVIFMYSYYKGSGEKGEKFYIMKTYVVTEATTYVRDETIFFTDLFNNQELKEASIKWFQEISGDEYRHINYFNYHFVEIEILEDFNAAAITCPKREDWKVTPNLYPSNRS